MTKVIAVVCSDLHLSHAPPAYRSCEPNWYDAMTRSLDHLTSLANRWEVPILCAGDVFDRWNASPELINFAIATMPVMYSVAGQHDLPHHNLGDIRRSAYWTLVEAGKLVHLDGLECQIKGMEVTPFNWGQELVPKERTQGDSFVVHVALIHRYCWTGSRSYPGASNKDEAIAYVKKLKGFDVAIFGDNHIPFINRHPNLTIFNCGTFMVRRSDDIKAPRIGVLYDDRSFGSYGLDLSEDVYSGYDDVVIEEGATDAVKDFLKELDAMKQETIDFEQAVRTFAEKRGTSPGVKKVILNILEEVSR